MLFIQYPKCSTCQKAKKWLEAHNITYTERHIADNKPSYDELKEWHQKADCRSENFLIQADYCTKTCT